MSGKDQNFDIESAWWRNNGNRKVGAIQHEIQRLGKEYLIQNQAFSGRDNYYAGFALLMTNDIFGDNIESRDLRAGTVDYLERRRAQKNRAEHPSSEANHFLRAVQYEIATYYQNDPQFLNLFGGRVYPWSYQGSQGRLLPPSEVSIIDSAVDYRKALSFIFADKQKKGQKFAEDIIEYNISTTVEQRYSALKLFIANWYALRNLQPPRVMDFGASVKHGMEALALDGQQPRERLSPFFKSIQNVHPLFTYRGSSQLLEERVNSLVQGCGMPLGPSVAVDILPQNAVARRWARACLRPGELMDEDKMKVYDLLDGSDQVEYLDANLLEEAPLSLAGEKFDIIHASTVFNQLSQGDAAKLMFDIFPQYLVPPEADNPSSGGRIMVVDFCDIDNSTPSHLQFPESIYSGEAHYQAFVINPWAQDPRQLIQRFIVFNDGRCESALLADSDYLLL